MCMYMCLKYEIMKSEENIENTAPLGKPTGKLPKRSPVPHDCFDAGMATRFASCRDVYSYGLRRSN